MVGGSGVSNETLVKKLRDASTQHPLDVDLDLFEDAAMEIEILQDVVAIITHNYPDWRNTVSHECAIVIDDILKKVE